MKRAVVFVFVILSILIINSGFLSATIVDDLRNQVNRANYYGLSYEENNIDYSQLITNLNSVKESVNELLHVKGDGSLTQSDLISVLGTPESSNWVLSEDKTSEVQVADPVFVWAEKIILDGERIQLKMSIVPSVLGEGISYDADFSVVFKEAISENILKANLDKVKTLAKTYALNPEDLQKANELARESINTEKIFDTYFRQSGLECREILSDLFGNEKLVDKKEIVVEEYNIYTSKNGEYKANVLISICEKCDEEWTDVDWRLTRNNERIMFPVETLTEEQFEDFGIPGIKRDLIESLGFLDEVLSAENYNAAYSVMTRMEFLNNIWNAKSNVGTQGEIIANSVDRVQFYSSLFEDYTLESTAFYTQEEYKDILYTEFNEAGGEICDNGLDDNNNEQVDCLESICLGQVCGTKVITTVDGNNTIETEIPLYCIDGACQEKQEVTKVSGNVCGNAVCESGEENTCPKDCTICPTYDAIQCAGQTIYKGEDVNGCPLEPICVTIQSNSCNTASDCKPVLCGTVECIQNTCVPKLTQCSQPKCVEGEKKFQKCASGENIATEICSKGVWVRTGALCVTPIGEPTQVVIASVEGACTKVEDCKAGSVCSAGVCTETAVNSKPGAETTTKTFSQTQSFSAKTVSGQVIRITGEPITGTGITSAIGDPTAEEFLGEVDPTTVPERTYEESVASRAFRLPGVRESEQVELFEETPARVYDIFTSPSEKISSTTSQNIKEEFIANGVCKTNKYETSAQLHFTSSGNKFDFILNLQERYSEKGPWCEFRLREELGKREAIEKSFNQEFAKDFYNNLYYYAEDWQIKKEELLGLYKEVTDNEKELAYMMDCLGVVEIPEFVPINFEYKSEYGEIKVSETLENVNLPGMARNVKIPKTSMEASLFLSREFVKDQLKKNMNAFEFPSRSNQRLKNGGLTDEEKIAFDKNQDLKDKIREIVAETKDGFFDAQIIFVDSSGENGEEIVYNLYVRVNENQILIQPMTPEAVPSALDARITTDYNAVYDLMFVSEENAKETLTVNPDWDSGGLKISKSINLLFNWIDTRSKISGMMDSLEISPERDGVNDLFKDVFFLVATN